MAREYRVEIAGLANPLRLQENDRSVACDYRHTGRTAAGRDGQVRTVAGRRLLYHDSYR